MADLEPPTLGEVLRRLDALSTQLVGLVSELKEDRVQAAKTYLRADLYAAERSAQNAIVADLHRDIGKVDADFRAELAVVRTDYDAKFGTVEVNRKEELGWRRQVLLFIGGTAVTSLFAIVGFILNILTSR